MSGRLGPHGPYFQLNLPGTSPSGVPHSTIPFPETFTSPRAMILFPFSVSHSSFYSGALHFVTKGQRRERPRDHSLQTPHLTDEGIHTGTAAGSQGSWLTVSWPRAHVPSFLGHAPSFVLAPVLFFYCLPRKGDSGPIFLLHTRNPSPAVGMVPPATLETPFLL